MDTSIDGSESVDQFLARIASLKEGRDEASEERTKRMEEDFQKSRKERQARRLERARSLSPSKTGPAASNSNISSPALARETVLNPPVDFSPRASNLIRSNAVRTSPTLEPKHQEPTSPTISTPVLNSSLSPSPLSRSGTLSWQQRPSAREGSPSRPAALPANSMIRPVSQDGPRISATIREPTRHDITASLAARDPAWFRQTQDRGASSAAYRKHQVEDTPTIEPGTRSLRLPGLTKDPAASADHGTPKSAFNKAGVSQDSPISLQPKQQNPSALQSETPITSLSPDKSAADADSVVQPTADTVQTESGLSVRARSSSPTKRLGGFVQSAMMKRSDSVNKRWNVQASPGLKRGDSSATTRPLPSRPKSMVGLSYDVRRTEADNEIKTSITPRLRPGQEASSKSSKPIDDHPKDLEEVDQKPPPAASTTTIEMPESPTDNVPLSRSPSKTLDSRRWSPTKSSWLESTLLSKPEPPKPTAKIEEQPRWKVDLQRSRSMKDTPFEKPTDQPQNISQPSSNDVTVSTRSQSSTFTNVEDLKDNRHVDKGSEKSLAGKDAQRNVQSSRIDSPAMFANKLKPTEIATKSLATPPEIKPAKKPPVAKPKPQTPPKIDFRASLKPRNQTIADSSSAEPEFKAVFGKLKSAQTQNYVAPDVLKTNILGGKAALNTTDGPQKSKRVDEFKESILQKKEAMKTSGDQKKQLPTASVESKKPEAELPEALARRRTLHKATPSITQSQDFNIRNPSTLNIKPKPTIVLKDGLRSTAATASIPANIEKLSLPGIRTNDKSISQAGAVTDVVGSTSRQTEIISSATRSVKSPPVLSEAKLLPNRISSKLEGPQVKPENSIVPAEMHHNNTLHSSEKASDSLSQPIATVAKSNGSTANSRLASSINPNLATLLSKTINKRPAANASLARDEESPVNTRSATLPSNQEDLAGGDLTHLTKGRARGPKRRAPKPTTTTENTNTVSAPAKASLVAEERTPAISAASPKPKPATPKKVEDIPIRTIKNVNMVAVTSDDKQKLEVPDSVLTMPVSNTSRPIEMKAKPAIAAKSPDLRKVSSNSQQQPFSATSPSPITARKPEITIDERAHLTSPRTMLSSPSPSPRDSALPLTPNKPRVNNISKPDVDGLDVKKPQEVTLPNRIGKDTKPRITPTAKPAGLSERPATKDVVPKPGVGKVPSTASDSAAVIDILDSYFPMKPTTSDTGEFDTQALLTATVTDDSKSKTTSHSIWKVNNDGKKTAMPPQQEHMLYEDSMYLSIHSYQTTTASRQIEVLLWCGDGVPDAAIEDVQLFCKKDAREHNAKLEVIRQGKEPASFFRALGGIVIIRRSQSSAFYMLCGRRHLGHVTFDEVDLRADSLCSGFPYLVSAKFGKLFLWKGKGSAADEIGCARLIGMDLGLTGEIEEIDEGAETDAFWEAFGEVSQKRVWSQEWQQRAEHNTLAPTMYRVEQGQPKPAGGFWGLRASSPSKPSNKLSVERIEPFCARDVDNSNVYILDTYRSVYVLIDADAASKTSEFTTSLHLAQEISLLSPSIQKRSIMPSCYVAFGEPPADVKACFRKWPADRKRISNKPSACVKLEEVMQSLGL